MIRTKEINEKSIQAQVTDFALEAIELYKTLKWHNELVLSKKFLSCATLIGAYLFKLEGDKGLSKSNTNIQQALENAQETKYWLYLLSQSQYIEYNYQKHITKIDSIIKNLEKQNTIENKLQGFIDND